MSDGSECDPHGEMYIRNYLRRPHFLLTGTDLRVFSAMGDRFARHISATMELSRPLGDPQLQAILAAVYASVEYPQDVRQEEDREPSESVRLLKVLLTSASSDQKTSIETTLRKIKKLDGIRDSDRSKGGS